MEGEEKDDYIAVSVRSIRTIGFDLGEVLDTRMSANNYFSVGRAPPRGYESAPL